MRLNDHTLSVTAGTVTAYLLNLYADYKLKVNAKTAFSVSLKYATNGRICNKRVASISRSMCFLLFASKNHA